MNYLLKSIRPFIGAKNYEESRAFYRSLGFEEVVIDGKMCVYNVNESLAFYLQDYYVEDWINNTMLVLEVDDLDKCAEELVSKGLPEKYEGVRISEIHENDWGREVFMNDPAGVLWHFCEFKR